MIVFFLELTDQEEYSFMGEVIQVMNEVISDFSLFGKNYNINECLGKCMAIAFGNNHPIRLECRVSYL